MAPRRRLTGLLCTFAATLAIAIVVLSIALASAPDEGFRLAARYTARLAFLCFLPVYVASAWQRLAPSRASRWLMTNRRSLGLAFATVHTIHLFALTAFNVVTQQTPRPVALVIGGGAYGMMFAMAATSNDASVRRLGARNWKRLHAVGVQWLWFVFTATYAGRIADGKREFVPLLGLALLALGARIVARLRARARAAAAGAVLASE